MRRVDSEGGCIMGPVFRTTSSLVSAVVVFVLVTLLVTWMLEDESYFSVFGGIPAGALCAVVVSASVTRFLRKQQTEQQRAASPGRCCGP
jgi:heme O synthase-like polyprenyltransferase